MSTSYVIDAVRTPRGRGKPGKGSLSGIHSQELFAQLLNALRRRNGFDAARVDDVIAGCVSQAGEQGANLARNAVLTAGWPIEVSATTLNRFCGSGLQAVHFAAMGTAGALDLVVAGGVETMSRVPMGSDGGGEDGRNEHLRERYFQVPQGITRTSSLLSRISPGRKWTRWRSARSSAPRAPSRRSALPDRSYP
jgi:acetyl-CoA C-acetyltransferase